MGTEGNGAVLDTDVFNVRECVDGVTLDVVCEEIETVVAGVLLAGREGDNGVGDVVAVLFVDREGDNGMDAVVVVLFAGREEVMGVDVVIVDRAHDGSGVVFLPADLVLGGCEDEDGVRVGLAAVVPLVWYDENDVEDVPTLHAGRGGDDTPIASVFVDCWGDADGLDREDRDEMEAGVTTLVQ